MQAVLYRITFPLQPKKKFINFICFTNQKKKKFNESLVKVEKMFEL